MTAPTIEIEIVEAGTGTIKYLVAETDQDPYVAQDIIELLDEVGDFATTDVFLLTPGMQLALVHVEPTDVDGLDWEVTLGTDGTGELIERVEFASISTRNHPNQLDSHVSRVDGWEDPAA